MLTEYIATLISENGLRDCTYAEPFAGGAGAAINLLLAGKVSRIVLNDADRCIWAFWRAILDQTEEFIERIEKTPVTVDEWLRQKAVYENRPRKIIDLGFAAFYLNRCNRSGILTKGGVIGGLDQTGKWKIDARYNKNGLIKRIERIAAYSSKIEVFNLDAIDFLKTRVVKAKDKDDLFVYLDPPYYVKGSRLYLNYYNHSDHESLANFLNKSLKDIRWIATYDNTPAICDLYSNFHTIDFSLRYSAHSAKDGQEIMIYSPKIWNEYCASPNAAIA